YNGIVEVGGSIPPDSTRFYGKTEECVIAMCAHNLTKSSVSQALRAYALHLKTIYLKSSTFS
ncbi:MAG: hypothetical protein LBD17_03325, partial [Endomicrobium sp.]|nr:hypothetical protein [Endomicrobium sp.]